MLFPVSVKFVLIKAITSFRTRNLSYLALDVPTTPSSAWDGSRWSWDFGGGRHVPQFQECKHHKNKSPSTKVQPPGLLADIFG